MLCVFIKELKQTRHSQVAVLLLILTLILSLGNIAISARGNNISFSHTCLGVAYLFAGIYQLAIIINSATRWKHENGNGSLDIICTTPISPLSVAFAKISAATLCAFIGMALPVIASEFSVKDCEFVKYIITAFLQVSALSSVSLGAASFMQKKNNSFDWTIILTVLALLPFISMLSLDRQIESTEKLIAVGAGFLAVSAFGIAFAVCGASPKNSDRAMLLKITSVGISIVLPVVYKLTIMKDNSFREISGLSLYIITIGIMFAALFERKIQTRRVLANLSSKLLFPFSTGVANSFVLFVILGILAYFLRSDAEYSSILAKLFLLTGVCQLTRDKNGNKFPTIPVITVGFITLILGIALPFTPNETAEYIRPTLFYTKSPTQANIICVLLGAVIYTVVSIPTLKQYFIEEKKND